MEGLKDYNNAKEKLKKAKFPKGILAFGSARLKDDDDHVKEVEEIAKACAERVLAKKKDISFISGGGPSVMNAWLKGAYSVGVKTSGMALLLPHETKSQQLQFCDQETSFIFETFATRKTMMIEYAKCIVVFKGGSGTLDELFEALVAMKTGKIKEFPIFIYPADFYENFVNFSKMVEAGTIKPSDYDTIHLMHSKEELLKNLFAIIDNE